MRVDANRGGLQVAGCKLQDGVQGTMNCASSSEFYGDFQFAPVRLRMYLYTLTNMQRTGYAEEPEVGKKSAIEYE